MEYTIQNGPYMPNNEAVERGLLRIIISEPRYYNVASCAQISENSFYYPNFQRTWKAITQVANKKVSGFSQKDIEQQMEASRVPMWQSTIKYIMGGDVDVGMFTHFVTVLKEKETRRHIISNMLTSDVFGLSDLLANSSVFENAKYIYDATLETLWNSTFSKDPNNARYIVRVVFPEDRHAEALNFLNAVCYTSNASRDESYRVEKARKNARNRNKEDEAEQEDYDDE